MKGQLYIGDDMVAETVEVVSPPRAGDLVIYEGKRLRIREVGHNVDKKKLQIMCHVPATPTPEYDPNTQTLQHSMQQVEKKALDEYLEEEAEMEIE